MWVYAKNGRSFLFRGAERWEVNGEYLYVMATKKERIATFLVSELIGWHFQHVDILTYTASDKLEEPDA